MNILKSKIAPFLAFGLATALISLAARAASGSNESETETLEPLYKVGDVLWRKSYLDDEDFPDRAEYNALEIVEVDTENQIYWIVYTRWDPGEEPQDRTFIYLHTNYVNSDTI